MGYKKVTSRQSEYHHPKNLGFTDPVASRQDRIINHFVGVEVKAVPFTPTLLLIATSGFLDRPNVHAGYAAEPRSGSMTAPAGTSVSQSR
jgi:hypothetical protein